MPKNIGKIVHYFPKINVAIVKLTASDLKLGDKVEITNKNGNTFTQTVVSMQIEHAGIEIAKSGDEFGLKVDKSPGVGSTISKL